MVTTSCALYPFCTRDCGCIERPAFPTPSDVQMAKELMQNSRACGEIAKVCLTFVVPAKAGTHSHKRFLEQKLSVTVTKPRGRGVWVPAFAGTTNGSRRERGGVCNYHRRHSAHYNRIAGLHPSPFVGRVAGRRPVGWGAVQESDPQAPTPACASLWPTLPTKGGGTRATSAKRAR